MNRQRILDRLLDAERSEPDVHRPYDYRQARICVALATRGESMPFVTASYAVHGMHPDAVFPFWLVQQRAALGDEFALWYSEDGVLLMWGSASRQSAQWKHPVRSAK